MTNMLTAGYVLQYLANVTNRNKDYTVYFVMLSANLLPKSLDPFAKGSNTLPALDEPKKVQIFLLLLALPHAFSAVGDIALVTTIFTGVQVRWLRGNKMFLPPGG